MRGVDWQSTERVKLTYNQIPKLYPSFAYLYETECMSVSVGMVHKLQV